MAKIHLRLRKQKMLETARMYANGRSVENGTNREVEITITLCIRACGEVTEVRTRSRQVKWREE